MNPSKIPFKRYLKTPLFKSGTNALLASIYSLNIKPNDSIAIPDYYCEDEINTLSRYFKINFYSLDLNLLPEKESFKKVLKKDIKLIILVQYFNFIVDLKDFVDAIKSIKKYVIIDAVHLFIKSPCNFYPNADVLVYSLKKPLFLNEGALAFKKNNFLKTDISLKSFSPKRNFLTLLKMIRFFVSYVNFLNHSILFAKSSNLKNENNNSIESADLLSICIFKILTSTNIVHKLNKSILFKINEKIIFQKSLTEILNFGFLTYQISNEQVEKYFLWPLAINNERSKFWSDNAENLYKSSKIAYPYFEFHIDK